MMNTVTASIDVDALHHNFAVVRRHAPHSKIIAVIKANAYGHGLLQVANTLVQADAYAVARLEEALVLRANAITKPILVLGGFFSAEALSLLAAQELQTTLHTWEQLALLERAQLPAPVRVWLKLDTGMNRLGVREQELPAFIERLGRCKNVVQPFHLMTHFSQSDEQDSQATQQQIEAFKMLTAHLPGEKAMANSAGILAWPDSRSDWIRPGIMLYGASPFGGQLASDHGLRPVMTLKSQLIAIRKCKRGESVGYGAHWVAHRDTTLGVVAVGYGDGYPRMAPEGTPMLVNGRRVPIVGRVAMDMITVDLGPQASDQCGDEVILWGEGLPVEQVAEKIGTIPYELLTRLTSRVSVALAQPCAKALSQADADMPSYAGYALRATA
ncbi:MAG: alanine racemase [Pseudomonadota bacterium]|uniref:Alanine racemase n=1 Tax=Aeromonas popoffii TaxID=70856 RepID=A0ABS5GPQ8_9GAMM|nr:MULTISPECIES: alanine racemase [Aeromonas]MBR7629081.1 alanine racemase [Aeromonas popoffii]